MANEENVKSQGKRKKGEQRKLIQKSGSTGETRQGGKSIREALRGILSGQYEIGGETVTGYEALAWTAFQTALEGNVQLFKEIRDTIGERPKDSEPESGLEGVKEIRISFVDKSGRKSGAEQDPKIVGEYTPGIETEET